VSDPSSLDRVRRHLRLYEHPLLTYSARENDGAIEILIDLKNVDFKNADLANDGGKAFSPAVTTYVLRIHPRDLEPPQFAWSLQRQIYDGLHDYFIEMFIRTPQDRDFRSSSSRGLET
jgi:hypothetical protein